MKRQYRRWLYLGLVLEAAVLILFLSTGLAAAGFAGTAVSFPWYPIGQGLRALSLSGGVGNVLAWLLFVLFCLLPIGYLAAFRRRRFSAADWLLVLFSILLFPAMYGMVNPGLLRQFFPALLGAEIPVWMTGYLLWCILLSYGIMRVLYAVRNLSRAESAKIFRWLSGALALLDVLFIGSVFGNSYALLLEEMRQVRAANTALPEEELWLTMLFLILGWGVHSLPTLLDLRIVHALLRLLEEVRQDRYTPQAIEACARTGRIAAATAVWSVVIQVAFLLMELAAARFLYRINFRMQFSVLPIIFALGALLLSRWMTESREIREENEGFI